MTLSVVIPTFGREAVLVETIRQLLAQQPPAGEILVMDQTPVHEASTRDCLEEWSQTGAIRWIRLAKPGIPQAMNRGLLEAGGEVVLFLDDDIVPLPGLIQAHLQAYTDYPDAWAVAGQVLQPGQEPEDGAFRLSCLLPRPAPDGEKVGGRGGELGSRGLMGDLDFPFNSTEPTWVRNVMAGNLSMHRREAIAVGGFDENFKGVAYRFETEFCRRLWASGGKVRFEPLASIRHLRVAAGGTRQFGAHQGSISPVHGVGDYYFALRCGAGLEHTVYWLRRPVREVFTRFYLRRPWLIPVKLVGELRAMKMAFRLNRQGPRLIGRS